MPPPLPAEPAPGTLNSGALTHRYRLLAQRPQTFPGGTNRLVSQREFPISATMTGALMRIKPGSLRELHWHPNADEWQYYIAGRARMGVFGSHGRVRSEEFGAGDVGYVPQGYGHYIENSGAQDLELLIVLNDGRYELISLTAWMAANPQLSAGDQFRRAGSHLRGFPDRRTVHAVGWAKSPAAGQSDAWARRARDFANACMRGRDARLCPPTGLLRPGHARPCARAHGDKIHFFEIHVDYSIQPH